MPKLTSERFGEIEYTEEDRVYFPHGLIGFSQEKHFVLMEDPQLEPFQWLHARDRSDLAFLVVNPFLFFPDYEIETEIDDQLRDEIGAVEDLAVLCIVTIADEFTESTLNLRGPIVLNTVSRKAFQIALEDSGYSTAEPMIQSAGERMPLVSVAGGA